MFPFSPWTSSEDYESRLRITEAKLLDFAQRYGTTRHVEDDETESLETFDAFDTYIPRSAVPCLIPAEISCLTTSAQSDDEDATLRIHCVRATRNAPIGNTAESCKIPLVNLHGYMNAGAYFYRNLAGLCKHFPTVYAVDMLGWGLSSRPSWEEVKESETIESAEDFFVESLEAWRSVVRVVTCALRPRELCISHDGSINKYSTLTESDYMRINIEFTIFLAEQHRQDGPVRS